MKKSAILIAATLLWCATGRTQGAPEHEPSPAQDPHPEYRSKGKPNGRFWRGLNAEEKLLWLVAYRCGLEDATFGAIQDRYPDAGVQTVVERLKDKMAFLYPPGLTLDEVGTSLETFFAAPENRPIPVQYALTMICFRVSGMSQAVLDEDVARLRRDWSGEK
jgi:hypothetical protein